MNYEEDVRVVCSTIFKVGIDSIEMQSTPESIDNWDSFNTLKLFETLENKYEIMFEFDELVKVKCVADIVELVRQKKL